MVERIRKEVSRFMDQPDPSKINIESIIDIAMQHYEDNKSVSIATLKSRAKNLKRFLPLHMSVMALDQKMLIPVTNQGVYLISSTMP